MYHPRSTRCDDFGHSSLTLNVPQKPSAARIRLRLIQHVCIEVLGGQGNIVRVGLDAGQVTYRLKPCNAPKQTVIRKVS